MKRSSWFYTRSFEASLGQTSLLRGICLPSNFSTSNLKLRRLENIWLKCKDKKNEHENTSLNYSWNKVGNGDINTQCGLSINFLWQCIEQKYTWNHEQLVFKMINFNDDQSILHSVVIHHNERILFLTAYNIHFRNGI